MSTDERLALLQGTLDLLILRTLVWPPARPKASRAIQQGARDALLVSMGRCIRHCRGWRLKDGSRPNGASRRTAKPGCTLTKAGHQATREKGLRAGSGDWRQRSGAFWIIQGPRRAEIARKELRMWTVVSRGPSRKWDEPPATHNFNRLAAASRALDSRRWNNSARAPIRHPHPSQEPGFCRRRISLGLGIGANSPSSAGHAVMSRCRSIARATGPPHRPQRPFTRSIQLGRCQPCFRTRFEALAAEPRLHQIAAMQSTADDLAPGSKRASLSASQAAPN
jgi:hypothetical protein